MTVEGKIKVYMQEEGIRQIDLSERTGIPATKINLTLNGHRRLTFAEYELVCGALEVSVDKFLTARAKEATA